MSEEKKKGLKAQVPQGVIDYLGLQSGDTLNWKLASYFERKAVTVWVEDRPLKSSVVEDEKK